MKTTCLLFLTISWSALMPGTGYTVPFGSPFQPTSSGSSANAASDNPRETGHIAPADDGGRRTGQQDHGRTSHASRPPNGAKLNRPAQLPKGRKRSVPGNAMNPHQPGSDKSVGAARGGLIQNGTVHSALPVRTSSVFRLSQPSLNNVRHRGPNPAVVGGSAISDSRSIGALNGTRMSRKP